MIQLERVYENRRKLGRWRVILASCEDVNDCVFAQAMIDDLEWTCMWDKFELNSNYGVPTSRFTPLYKGPPKETP